MNAPVEGALRVTQALSLTQPWATLVAIGAKKFETRSWSTWQRGPLAIHASMGFPKECVELCNQEPYLSALRTAGYNHAEELPRGAVIAVVNLADCVSTNKWTPDRHSDEYQFGNYGPDRFAWSLPDARRITPFFAKGSLGIWTLKRPVTMADLLTVSV